MVFEFFEAIDMSLDKQLKVVFALISSIDSSIRENAMQILKKLMPRISGKENKLSPKKLNTSICTSTLSLCMHIVACTHHINQTYIFL